MAPRFKDQVVVVTGATSGIGRATAQAFAAEGALVIAGGRNQVRLGEVAREVALALTLDVTKAEQVAIFAAAVLDRFGGVDMLVNNAGVGLFQPWDLTTEADLRRVMEVDFFGAVRVAGAFLPSLIERHGVLVQVASVAGRRGYPKHTAYSAAKHALIGWSEALRRDVPDVTVCVVCPPAVRTPFFENAGYLTFDVDHAGLVPMSAEAVATGIVDAAHRRLPLAVLSRRARVLDLLNRVSPGLLEKVQGLK